MFASFSVCDLVFHVFPVILHNAVNKLEEQQGVFRMCVCLLICLFVFVCDVCEPVSKLDFSATFENM